MPLPQSTDCSLTLAVSLFSVTPASPSTSPLKASEGAPNSADGEAPQPAGGRGTTGETEPPACPGGSLDPDETCRNRFPHEPLAGDGSIML